MVLTRRFILILFLSILVLGFILRSNNLTVWPRHGATFDEFAWTWLGINLIKEGMPISWSPHAQYKNREYLKYQGADFWIVKPYLEHPPLFGIVAGSFAILNGAKDMYHVGLENIRPLALILGLASIAMVFVLTKTLYGEIVGITAMLLYAIVPTVAVGARIVQNENFLIPLWLLSLYFLSRYLTTKKILLRNASILIGAILPLAKVPWLVVPLSLSMILAYHKKWKDILLIFIWTSIFFTFFLFYGIYFDKELFFNLWGLQIARYDMSFVGLFSIFTKPLLVDRYYLDGWIYFGFISIFLLMREFKKHILIIFPFLAYLLIFILAIPDEPGHGWYRYPFYPFIIISIALFIKEYFTKNEILTFLFISMIGLALLQIVWVPSFGFSHIILRLATIGFALPLISLFLKSEKTKRLAKIINFIWFGILILLSILAVFIYNEQ